MRKIFLAVGVNGCTFATDVAWLVATEFHTHVKHATGLGDNGFRLSGNRYDESLLSLITSNLSSSISLVKSLRFSYVIKGSWYRVLKAGGRIEFLASFFIVVSAVLSAIIFFALRLVASTFDVRNRFYPVSCEEIKIGSLKRLT